MDIQKFKKVYECCLSLFLNIHNKEEFNYFFFRFSGATSL